MVLDTSVVVAAMRSDAGASRRLLVYALERNFELLLSVPLVLEYEAVLKREEQKLATGLSDDDIDVLVDALVSVAVPVQLAFLWRPASRDEKDDMVIETAFNGNADAVVSFNIADLREVSARLGIQVWRPQEALAAMEIH